MGKKYCLYSSFYMPLQLTAEEANTVLQRQYLLIVMYSLCMQTSSPSHSGQNCIFGCSTNTIQVIFITTALTYNEEHDENWKLSVGFNAETMVLNTRCGSHLVLSCTSCSSSDAWDFPATFTRFTVGKMSIWQLPEIAFCQGLHLWKTVCQLKCLAEAWEDAQITTCSFLVKTFLLFQPENTTFIEITLPIGL